MFKHGSYPAHTRGPRSALEHTQARGPQTRGPDVRESEVRGARLPHCRGLVSPDGEDYILNASTQVAHERWIH